MWNYIQEIANYLVKLALVGVYLTCTTSKFEVIAISILLLIYVRLDNCTLLFAAKADWFMYCIADGFDRIRQSIHDPKYDSEGEARGMAMMEKAAKGLMTRSRIDDAIFFALLLIVATKIFVTF